MIQDQGRRHVKVSTGLLRTLNPMNERECEMCFGLTEHEMHNLAPAQVRSFAISTQDNKEEKAPEKHKGSPGPQATIACF